MSNTLKIFHPDPNRALWYSEEVFARFGVDIDAITKRLKEAQKPNEQPSR